MAEEGHPTRQSQNNKIIIKNSIYFYVTALCMRVVWSGAGRSGVHLEGSVHVSLTGRPRPAKQTCAFLFLQPGCVHSWVGEKLQAPRDCLSGRAGCSDQSWCCSHSMRAASTLGREPAGRILRQELEAAVEKGKVRFFFFLPFPHLSIPRPLDLF